MYIFKSLCVMVFFVSLTFSQSIFTSLDTPVDPYSISMGESFVAVNHPLSSLMYNPASYNPGGGISFSFSHRNANYSDEFDYLYYYTFSLSYNCPIGEFGLLYNRLHWGEWLITSPSSPEGIGKANVFSHVILGKYSRPLNEHCSIGLTVKVFNEVVSQTEGAPVSGLHETSSLPVLFDAGAMYSLPAISSSPAVRDTVSLGLSLQNIGTDYREHTGSNPEQYVRLPHYLRIGFSYSLKTLPSGEHTVSVFSALLTGEYRNMFNSFADNEKDYWGFGSEFTFYDLLSLRLGGIIYPFQSVYGNKGVAMLRYGAGLQFPLEYLGINTPLTIHLDYAGIPTNSLVYSSFYFTSKTTGVLQIFSLGLNYTLDSSN